MALTLTDLLRYLLAQLVERLDQQDHDALASLSTTLGELIDAADHSHDAQLSQLLDDMLYYVNETLIGLPYEGTPLMREFDVRIQVLESQARQRQ